MKILIFDIVGKFAHFRKYYSNSTALSFTLPPRTTIAGILAAIIGREKEKYYSEFSSDKIRIGVALLTSIKKSFHRLNYLMVKGDKDFRGIKQHIQTPFEIVAPARLRDDFLRYRIFVSYYDDGKETFDELHEKIILRKPTYALSLGPAFFNATVENVSLIGDENIKKKESNGEKIEFYSAVVSDNVEALLLDTTSIKDFYIEEELLPADFREDNEREVVKFVRTLFIDGENLLPVQYKGEYYEIEFYNGENANVAFWE